MNRYSLKILPLLVMTKTSKHRAVIIFSLGLLSAIGPFSIDMYLPGFQFIADDLHTSIDKIQYSLSAFFVGIAAGQIIYGPLLDRFGRRNPLIVGMLIYIASSICCAFINTADGLIALRFVQALGSCGGMVASRALVRDYFPPTETAKVFSLLMLVIGISPVLAPTIGGYVILHWGWHGIFIALALIGVLVLCCVLFLLPKGKGANTSMSLKPRPIIQSFYTVFKTPSFYINAFAGGTAAASLYAYLSGSSFVMMELYQVSATQYGWIFGIIAGGLITASQLNSILLRKYTSPAITRTAVALQASTGLALFCLTAIGWMNLELMVTLIFVFLACQGFVFPNTSAMALNPFTGLAGSASALLGTIQMSIGAISSALVSRFHNGTAVPMTAVMAACSVISLTIILSQSRKFE